MTTRSFRPRRNVSYAAGLEGWGDLRIDEHGRALLRMVARELYLTFEERESVDMTDGLVWIDD